MIGRRTLSCVRAAVLTLLMSSVQAGDMGTAFVYQGRLVEDGVPVTGLVDFTFRLFDDDEGNGQIGSDWDLTDVVLQHGLFTVELDFGEGAFDGQERWLEIVIEGTPLSERQAIRPAPYALFAPGGSGTGYWSLEADHIHNSNAGHVGVGLASPLTPLHVRGAVNVDSVLQTMIVDGGGTDFSRIGFVDDEQKSVIHLGKQSGDDRFAIAMNTGTSGSPYWTERLTMLINGNVGISETNPSAKLEIGGTPGADGILFPDGTLLTSAIVSECGNADTVDGYHATVIDEGGGPQNCPPHTLIATQADGRFYLRHNISSNTLYVRNDHAAGAAIYGSAPNSSNAAIYGNGSQGGLRGKATGPYGIGVEGEGAQFGVYSIGDVCTTGSYLTCSDARFKENVTGLAEALNTILQLRGVSFDWKRDEYPGRNFDEGPQVGLIAQEVAEVLPEIVRQDHDGVDFYSVDYGRLTPILVEAVRELNSKLEGKNARVAELEERLAHLEFLVEAHLSPQTGAAE